MGSEVVICSEQFSIKLKGMFYHENIYVFTVPFLNVEHEE
jgi:hypothetical protein